MKQAILILTASLFLFAGCKKEDKLPAPTHHGANTLSCKIDGKVFLVKIKSSNAHPKGVYSIPYTHGEWVISASAANEIMHFSFQYENFNVPQSYPIADFVTGQAFYQLLTGGGTIPTGGNTYTTNSDNRGQITITHFTQEYAAGTFYFDAVNDASKIIHITEGHFDIEF